MADETTHDHDEVGDDVQWYLDADGTEWFAEDGVRFELADDGLAYPVVGGSVDPAGATPLEVVDEEADSDASPFAPAAAADTPVPPVKVTKTIRITSEGSVPADVTQVIEPVKAELAVDAVDAADAAAPAVAARVEATPRAAAEPVAAGRTSSGRIDAEPLLVISDLNAGYGSLPVLKGVDMDIRPGETAVLLGLNGAGKTTTAWTVCGALAPWGGKIMYDGKDVAGWNTSKAVQNGVVMVPEGRRVFPDLSVGRNLQVGAWGKRRDRDWQHAQRERVFDYFPRLRERVDQLAGTLSGGEQQMLAMGRGLMADPRLLIVDEASMGLAPVIVKDVFDIISQINKDGVTVLLIEQNVGALEVADVGYVMEQGHMVRVLEGEELRDRNVVSKALMG